MGSLSNFLQNMNWMSLLMTLMQVVVVLFCITIHELSHGYVAYRLGDNTAKMMGRLSLNPVKHIDWVGFLMMLTVGVGWAKAVPVDMRNFKNPKKGMALTALAGPLSNFLLAWVALLLANAVYHLPARADWIFYVMMFFLQMAILSVGLGIFNLIPISPLDGSKILFSILPDKAYYTVLRYEKYGMIVVIALAWFGFMSGPLFAVVRGALQGLCVISGFPFEVMQVLYF